MTDVEAVDQEIAELKEAKTEQGFTFKRLSASMMKTWLTCKRQFTKKYIEGIKDPANVSFSLGNACHFALEQANLSLIENPRQLSQEDLEEYLQLFRLHLAGALSDNHFVPDPALFTTGEELVTKELVSLNPNEKVLAGEIEFDLITPEGVRIYGFIDKLVEVDSSTIKVVDYKTSKVPLSYEEADVDVQLSMYDLAVAVLFPQYPNRVLELKYLRTGEVVRSDRSSIAQLNFRQQLLAVQTAIINHIDQYRESPKEVPGSLQPFCAWCGVKSDCPAYQSQLIQIGSAYNVPKELDDVTFLELYRKVQTTMKELEQLKDDLKSWAIQRIEYDCESPISDGENFVDTLSTTRRSYSVEDVAKYLKYEDFKKVATINNSKLTEFLDQTDNDLLRSRIEQAAVVKFNSPQLRIKKVK